MKRFLIYIFILVTVIFTLKSTIPKIAMGIIMIIGGVFYLIYSIKEIKVKMDKSGPFRQSILIKDFLIGIMLLIGGLILVIWYLKNVY